ncbi:FxDxF family PEP-CTERM protein [Thermaurantiacus tibetensis]|uniref:FxDxF family PEP-CTERM protein n=1 Tax=Thermaurantiacus tibetensis TaxID=2759035 RepID=UPI001F22640F|nr:FxDxF family PEP-CTERM protein [Thermaurantiacus tibetensis]
MNLSLVSRAAVAGLALAFAAVPAAAVSTFRQFQQANPSDELFVYTAGPVSSFTGTYTLGLSTPRFGIPPIFFPVTVTISATSTDPLMMMTPTTFAQTGWAGTITLTTTDPLVPGGNLLTVTFAGAVAQFESDGGPGNWAAALALAAPKVPGPGGSFIAYLTDYLPQKWIESSNANNFALSFSGGATISGPYAGTGTFAALVPEPATWAMLIAGFGMVGLAARRRRAAATIA